MAMVLFAMAKAVLAQAGSLPSAAEPAATAPPAAPTAIPSKNLLEIIRSGGVLMGPILLCSFVMLMFAFERAICLRRGNVIPRPFVKRFLHQLKEGALTPAEALQLCEENGSAVAQVFAGAVRKWGRSSVEVEQGLIDAGERVTNHLRRNLRVLNGVSTVCPLLGLLGTVFGMIDCFNTIAVFRAMGKPEMLADGISVALITTAAGLTIAIPSLILYLYFVSTVDRRIMEIDALGQEVVQHIAHDALPEASHRATRRREAA
jgi:biopolymer transport protein ExbB